VAGWLGAGMNEAAFREDGAGIRDSVLSDGSAAGMQSVRTGSGFYAGHHTPSSSMAFTAASFLQNRTSGTDESFERGYGPGPAHPRRRSDGDGDGDEDDDAASQATEIAQERAWGRDGGRERERREDEDVLDEVGAQEAFIAGMIWALSRRLMPRPGSAWSPVREAAREDGAAADERARWRLEECLK
jgi:hypothetical protein